MSRQPDFDPRSFAIECRRNRLDPISPVGLGRFGPRGKWHAGMRQLEKVIIGWWVAEPALFEEPLLLAREWLDAPEEEGRPWGDAALVNEAAHRLAGALAHWMVRDDRSALWEEAAGAQSRALASTGGAAADELVPALYLCWAMADMPHEGGANLPDVTSERSRAILACLNARGDRAVLGAALCHSAPALLTGQPGLDLMTLFALVFGKGTPERIEPDQCALPAYVLEPRLPLPPALRTRGWSDEQSALVAVPAPSFARIDALMPLLGLTRDPDAVAQDDLPALASWTRHPGLSLEADWHAADEVPPYLEIRGAGAGRLAALLADIGTGRVAPDPQDALTELLTVPRRAEPANSEMADARWEILCATLADRRSLEQMGGRALVSAGLADSDWRVRMAALWAVGHGRVPGLAAKAEAAALPKSAYSGLSQDDRRVLLAMRDLAAARSAGRADSAKPSANAGFLAKIAALLDALPNEPADRAELLLAALLRRPGIDRSLVPPAWKGWLN